LLFLVIVSEPSPSISPAANASSGGAEGRTEKGWDVLDDDISRFKLANDPSEFGPKTRALSVDPGSLAGDGEVLAGEASADEVDGGEVVGAGVSDVPEPLGVGEVLGKDGAAVGVLLDLPGDAHPCSLEAEVEAADACEERADIQRPSPSVLVESRIACRRASTEGSGVKGKPPSEHAAILDLEVSTSASIWERRESYLSRAALARWSAR